MRNRGLIEYCVRIRDAYIDGLRGIHEDREHCQDAVGDLDH